MQADHVTLQDVHARLKALEEARHLQPMVEGAIEQVKDAKLHALQAEPGSAAEQQYLHEAVEASERLTVLQESLSRANRELRRTEYLVKIISE